MNMRPYLLIGLMGLLLLSLYQNCSGKGFQILELNKEGESSLSAPTLKLDTPSSVNVDVNDSLFTVAGDCETGNYPQHTLVLETFTTSGQALFTKEFQNVCLSQRLNQTLDLTLFSRDIDLSFIVRLTLEAIAPDGTTVSSLPKYFRIGFSSSSTTGESTTGEGTTGGTTGESTTGSSTGETTTGGTTGETGGPGFCAIDAVLYQKCQNLMNVPNMESMVHSLAQERPDLIQNCDRRPSANPNWNAFTTELLRRLRSLDTRWGFNYVRGIQGDINGDTMAYYADANSQPGQYPSAAQIVDVVVSCGAGGANQPTWDLVEGSFESCCNKTTFWNF